VPGVVAPGTPARISSEAADSRRDAPTALALGGTSPTSGTSRAPRRRPLMPIETRSSEESTVPRRGGSSPPSRGLSPVTAPAPSGAGEEAEGRAGSGEEDQYFSQNSDKCLSGRSSCVWVPRIVDGRRLGGCSSSSPRPALSRAHRPPREHRPQEFVLETNRQSPNPGSIVLPSPAPSPDGGLWGGRYAHP